MKQKQLIYKPVLWFLFGFALINAIHAIIEALIYLYFHYGLVNGFIDFHFQYYMPAFSIVITFIMSIICIIILKKRVTNLKVKVSKLPWLLFSFLIAIAAITKPLIHIWSEKKIMMLYDDLSKSEYLSELNLVKIFNIIKFSCIGSQWLLFTLILIAFLYLNRKSKT